MDNIEVVQAALGAVRGGDLEAAASVVSTEFVWHIPGRGPISGDVRGAAAWHERLTTLLGAGLQPEVLAMLQGGDRVAAVQRNRAVHGEQSLDVSVVNLFTVADGKVTRLETYFGDQYAADDFWTAVLG